MMVPFFFPRLPRNLKTADSDALAYREEEQPTIQYIRSIRFGLVRERVSSSTFGPLFPISSVGKKWEKVCSLQYMML